MATNNQGNRTGSNRSRRSHNNNPEGHNQYSGWTDTARERPFATAAAAAAAVGASVFLWSRRGQISNQLNNLSEQIGEWTETMNARGGSKEFETAGSESRYSGSTSTGSSDFGSGSTSSGSSEFSTGSTGSKSPSSDFGSPSFDPTTGSSGASGRRGSSRTPASTPTGGRTTS